MNRSSAALATKSGIASLAVLTTVAGGAAAVALIPGTASASTHHQVHTLSQTIRYADMTAHFVGKNADKPVVGDESIDVAPVRSQATVIGHATNICTLVAGTSDATSPTQCVGTSPSARAKSPPREPMTAPTTRPTP